MTRRAHDEKYVVRALVLSSRGYGYDAIKRLIKEEMNYDVGESTIRDWVTYHSRQVAVPVRLLRSTNKVA